MSYQITQEQVEDHIQQLEKQMFEIRHQLRNYRMMREHKSISDYQFHDEYNNIITWDTLFGTTTEIILIQNMGQKCNYCSLWGDELSGIYFQLYSRVPVYLMTPDSVEDMKKHKSIRKWHMPMISTIGTNFKKDTGFENLQGGALPGVMILRKLEDNSIVETNRASFGPGDDYCSLWNYFDLLQDENPKWRPLDNTNLV